MTTSSENKGPSRISEAQVEQRYFVDALRNCLGMAPLYAPEVRSSYFDERSNEWELAPGCRRSPTGI